MFELQGPLAILATIWFSRMWYSVPLVVVISLVYAATRHEAMKPILEHSMRFGLWVLAFMFVVFVVLSVLSLWL
jgi:hypothetical protein